MTLAMTFVDLHHHIIHGVDDGPASFEQTRQMLRRAAENGITTLAATSHALPGERLFPLERYCTHLKQAQAWCEQENLDLTLCEGAEILYAPGTERLLQEGAIPTLNHGRSVLVEFLPGETYETLYNAVRRLGNAGYTVIAAHAERYHCLRKTDRVRALRDELGAWIQINAGTFIAPTGFGMKRWLREIMRQGLCDVAATDAHNVSGRPCRMRECYTVLAREWGPDMADRLCRINPLQLLGHPDEQGTDSKTEF